jgi:AmmeMemoRadiSam system protein B
MERTGPKYQPSVRAARYAGTWYPGNAAELRQSVSGYLAKVNIQQLPARPKALVCPHPGHMFGGQVAATAVAQVKGMGFKRVVLLGPLHRPIPGSGIGDCMVPRETHYATPLGQIPVDVDFIAALSRLAPLTRVQNDNEHSLEIELPFLQLALESFTLVPIMLGLDISDPGTPAVLEALAAGLAHLAEDDTLVVASTDLSHLDNYAEVVRIDKHLVDLVNAFDIPALTTALAQGEVYACGATGLVTALRAAQLRNATGARVLSCTNSGDILRDRRPGSYTVGYMAAVAY